MRRLLTLMLAALLVVAPASLAFADDAFQQSNSSDAATSSSGSSVGTNENSFASGGSATSGDGAADAQQNGTNSQEVQQGGSASTGDSAAGSQIAAGTGVNGTIQQQNAATDPVSTAGNSFLINSSELTAGPIAISDDGGVPNAQQLGDNEAVLSQSGTASSGDAVSGSQVAGLVDSEEATIQGQNSSTGAMANAVENDGNGIFGNSSVTNNGDVVAGPQALSLGESIDVTVTQECDGCTATTTVSVRAELEVVDAHASQIGDNTAGLEQDAAASTGDALAGSQISGAVAPIATIQSQNDSVDSTALTGSSQAINNGSAASGPVAGAGLGNVDVFLSNACTDGSTCVNTVDIDAVVSGEGSAAATQIGDNTARLTQASDAGTGDALAGSQVSGAVSDDATVQMQNVSLGDVALSGSAFASDDGNAVAGPFAGIQPFTISVAQFNTCTDSTCLNFSSVDVDIDGATIDPSASQVGDNAIQAVQDEHAASGDAVAGGQVTGIVGTGEVQVTGDTSDSLASTGRALGNGSLSGSLGPQASTDSDVTTNVFISNACLGGTCGNTVTVESTGSASGAAAAVQNGDNILDTWQDVTTSTGDAVSGGQVTGVVDA